MDYLKNTNNSVNLQDCPNYRAALVKNDGVYTLKIFFVSPISHLAYFKKDFDMGHRITAKKVSEIENIMDKLAVLYYEDPNMYYTYTEQVFKGGEAISETTRDWQTEDLEDMQKILDTWTKIRDDAKDKDFGELSGYNLDEEKMDDRWIAVLSYYDHQSGLNILRGLVCKWENVNN
jgi:hypothetical protein